LFKPGGVVHFLSSCALHEVVNTRDG
jgi:hypothetical protein